MPSASSSSTLVPGWLAGTFAGGLLVHCCFIPLWVGCIVPPFLAVYLLFCGGVRMLAGLALIGLIVYLDFGITVRWRPWFMRLIYELNMTRYYSRCELRGALDAVKTERNLFMFHPHGILSVGFVCNGVWNRAFNDLASPPAQQKAILAARMGDPPGEPWRGTAFMIAQNLREWSGFFKVLCDVSGRLESATRQNLTRRMAEGRNVGIIPGGFEDATLHVQGRERTAMSDRKGLIKYALQHGYALTPIYTFGESETYTTFPYLLKPRLWLNRFGIPAVVFFGAPWMPLFPRRNVPIASCIGPPLQLPKLEKPTPEEVSKWHAAYLDALHALFDKHKGECGKPDAKLEIW